MRLSPSVLPFPLEWLPAPAYLVGGSVRDALLQGATTQTKLDLDLVLADPPLELASQIARRLQAGFVVLDKERQIARIVLPGLTVDIAKQVGSNIEMDLSQRDFTCNAVAFELHSERWLDPLQGVVAIQQRQIRMVCPDNLSADPLRLLRAYRQAAQLGFQLDPATQEAIRARAPLLAQVAAERVQAEISHLLAAGAAGIDWLEHAWADGILRDWLPELTWAGFGLARQMIAVRAPLTERYPQSFACLGQPLADLRTQGTMILLAALLVGLPSPERPLARLRYSRAEVHWIQKLHQLLPTVPAVANPSPSQQYRFFQAAGPLFPPLMLLAAASGIAPTTLDTWLRHYEDPADPVAHLVPLLDGHELIRHLGLRSGQLVGQVLQAVRLAQAEGQVTTAEQAIAYARRWLQTGEIGPD